MQPGDVVAVDPASLTAHAGHLDEFAADVEAATQAARYVRMHTAAYGQVCAFVPVVLNSLSSPLAEGLGSIVTSLRDTATRLRAAANEYAGAEARSAERQADPGR
jgi:Excreted virulence factor EspC, type VII ESX diderm